MGEPPGIVHVGAGVRSGSHWSGPVPPVTREVCANHLRSARPGGTPVADLRGSGRADPPGVRLRLGDLSDVLRVPRIRSGPEPRRGPLDPGRRAWRPAARLLDRDAGREAVAAQQLLDGCG